MTRPYRGMVIGGPRAGHVVENATPLLVFHALERGPVLLPHPDPAENPALKTHVHEFVAGFSNPATGERLNFWVPIEAGATQDPAHLALDRALVELVRSYAEVVGRLDERRRA